MARGGPPGCFAYLGVHELTALEVEHGPVARDEVFAQLTNLIDDGRKIDVLGVLRHQLALLLPQTPNRGARTRLHRLSQKVQRHEFIVGGRPVRLTPVIGYALITDTTGLTVDLVQDRAWDALRHAAGQLDLYPTRWRPELTDKSSSSSGRAVRAREWARTPVQVAVTQLACTALPFALYVALDAVGVDVTPVVFLLTVAALFLTALALWAECLAVPRRRDPPEAPEATCPPATAIIAAYLPNEAETVLDTVGALLGQDYPDLQVILAYNTRRELPVEAELRALAERDGRFLPLKVEGSTSKAQNINAALGKVTGEFVGLFDADHHPAPGSFQRASRWLASGADVVQGHCAVRNGGANWLTRIIGVEFELIYGVAHPGRARLHGFGVFGGTNGYWRTALLRATRMRSFMLTEDIDSSLRVVEEGGRIVPDPHLISTEFAPDRLRTLWNQRLRWAQGWSQVSFRHLLRALRSSHLNVRQKLGVWHLLGWREVYPWISLQIAPIIAFWLYRGQPPVDWFVPVFVVTTIFTLSVGPAQTWFAWREAAPNLRAHPAWFWFYLLGPSVFYSEFKNIVARTAHLKEIMRESAWKVTPRPAFSASPGGFAVESALRKSETAAEHRAALDSGANGRGRPPTPKLIAQPGFRGGETMLLETLPGAQQAGEDRDRMAGDRDERARARDQEAEARDDRATRRDEQVDDRKRGTGGASPDAAADRAETVRDRRAGASDRARAAHDRDAGAVDRFTSAREREEHVP